MKKIPISCKMLDVSIVQSMMMLNNVTLGDFEKEIKKKMALEIAEKMINNNLIFFTKMDNHSTYDVIYRARAFISSRENVELLVKNGYKND